MSLKFLKLCKAFFTSFPNESLSLNSYIAAANPEYLEKSGIPESPQDLISHSCIVTTYNRWLFTDNTGNTEIKANKVNTVVGALDLGALQCILKNYWANRGITWIVYANRKYLPARARLAIGFLIKKFESF